MSFSIVIPIYNEEDNIVKLYNEIISSLNNLKYEILFIDDSSNDNSLIKINSILVDKKVKLIKNNKNMGQSFSILNGVNNAIFNTIVTIDGDGQNDPKDIKKLTNMYFENDQILLIGGIRKERKDNIIKKISSFSANLIRSKILQDDCMDTGCALKVFDKQTFLSFPYFDGIHRFLPALFKGFKKKTLFINVNHRKRIFGKSKYGIYNRLFKGIRDTIKVYFIIKAFKG